MSSITCQFVRPDKLLFEGHAKDLTLLTPSGEVGVWPGHAAEICALGDGVVRLHPVDEEGGGQMNVIISGGYAEISNDTVIILADHARRSDDIEPDVVRQTRQKAFDAKEQLAADDHSNAYYDEKIKWCNLLLKHTASSDATATVGE